MLGISHAAARKRISLGLAGLRMTPFIITLGTLGVVIIGSLYKTAALAKGGSAVAEALGGRLLSPNTSHPEERKLGRDPCWQASLKSPL